MSRLKEVLYKNLPTMTITELYGYINEIEGGYIKARYHPEDNNIVILNYTELATYERRWNKYTMTARGLILDLTNATDNGKIHILAKPFEKFPNFGSNEIEGYEDDIDFNEIESVMEKMDGSLGISYFFNNEIHFATRGSFTSEQAIKAKEIWDKKYSKNENISSFCRVPVTYLVEIIYPQNRVVVDYQSREELVLIGTTIFADNNLTIDADYEHLMSEAAMLNMPIAHQYSYTLKDMIKLRDKLSTNEEGWIIKFKNGKRFKIKGEEYLAVHRAIYGLSDKAKVKAWSEDRIDDLIRTVPEEFRGELESLRDGLNKQKELIYEVVHIVFDGIYDIHKDNRKEFAIRVNKSVSVKYRGIMFAGYKNDGQIPINMIKEFIFKNYEHYLEEIRCRREHNNLS